jgi:hypothetical protein
MNNCYANDVHDAYDVASAVLLLKLLLIRMLVSSCCGQANK